MQSNEDLFETQRKLSAEYNIPWRECSTIVYISDKHPAHHPMPPWLNPHDKRIIEDAETLERWQRNGKRPTSMYEQRINALALRHLGKTWDDMKTDADWREFKATKKLVVPEIEKTARRFLEGFPDVTGNYWCGQCYTNQQFMNIGQALGYPALWSSETKSGYEGWLHTAQYSGCVVVESGLRLAKKIQIEQKQKEGSNANSN